MGTLTAPEIRPILDSTPLQRAKSRHAEVLEICQHLVAALHAWGRLGKLCTLVERDKDWELLGYKSFGAWMMAVETSTGYSRSAAYQYMKLFRELEPNGDHVMEMSLGTAQVFKQLPAALQRDPEVSTAAKRMKPSQFREKIAQDHPDAHVEVKERIELSLDASFSPIFHEVVDSIRILEEEPEMSYESVIELAFISWMNENWGDSDTGITNLARARQLRNLK